MKELKRRVGGGGGRRESTVRAFIADCLSAGLKGWQSGKKSVQLSSVAMRSVVCSLTEI